MVTIKQKNNYHIVKNEIPVYGGYYSIVKNCITIKDGLSLDAANEIFNNLTK